MGNYSKWSARVKHVFSPKNAFRKMFEKENFRGFVMHTCLRLSSSVLIFPQKSRFDERIVSLRAFSGVLAELQALFTN